MSLSFKLQPETSYPFEDLREYLYLLETITSKMVFLQHLLRYGAELLEIRSQSTIIFVLKRPFPHFLMITSPRHTHPESMLDLVEVIHGTVYESRGIRLLCEAEVFPSVYAYWIWKSQQEQFYGNQKTVDAHLFAVKYVSFDKPTTN